ncbi:right-handed parallel beta-helix repeat-containing protein, partial [bacterium]|nr:right-handed parallel beta-helix repeat-containing protein [bacterium]
MKKELSFLLILAVMMTLLGQASGYGSEPVQRSFSISEAQKAEAQEHIAQLFQRIQEMKAANQYDDALWREYLALTEGEAPSIDHLDQGGSICATATVIPYLPFGDLDTLDYNGNDDCAGQPYQDVFYRYTAVENGVHLFHMCNAASAGDTYIRIWLDGTCCVGSYVSEDDNCFGGGLDGMVWVDLTIGQTIYIECGYYYTTGGTTYALYGLGPGFDCWNPIVVNLPADAPYSDTNTTCGKINYYTETCLGSYDEGQDILYRLDVSSAVTLDIELTSNATWVGMVLDNNCPPAASCLYSCVSAGSSCSLDDIPLAAGTYYLMIDTWPEPDCIPEFTLTITNDCQLSGSLSGTMGPGLCRVIDNIWVDSGNTLAIQPGTILLFEGPFSLRVYGYLFAFGTVSDSIVFTTEQTGVNRWSGLRFEGEESSGSGFDYCLIEKGYATNTWPDNCGGGIYCHQSYPAFTNCIIRDNLADYFGGGVFCWESASPSFINCSLIDNSASYGGGIGCYSNSSPGFGNCRIEGNTATYQGGGIWSHTSWPPFTNCTLSNNTAPQGGGIYFESSTPAVSNTIIAFSNGSGIYFFNSATGVFLYNDVFGNSGGNFQYFNNDPSQGPAGIGQLAYTNANGDSCDNGLNIFLDPLFVNRHAGDFHLTDTSPCIGAGDPYGSFPTDFEGDPRPNPSET